MNKEEFLDQLQRTLAGGINSSQVASNVNYYRDYIDSEVRQGRSEEDVLGMLGEPRLLAKSIIEANKRAGDSDGDNRVCDDDYQSDANSFEKEGTTRVTRIPGWLILILLLVVIFAIISFAFSLFIKLLPIIIPVALVCFLVKTLKEMK